MAGRVGFPCDAVQGRACGAEVGDGGGGEVVVLELLRHGADDGAEVLVAFVGGAGEAREYRIAEIVV